MKLDPNQTCQAFNTRVTHRLPLSVTRFSKVVIHCDRSRLLVIDLETKGLPFRLVLGASAAKVEDFGCN
jgi:hypothetical protein